MRGTRCWGMPSIQAVISSRPLGGRGLQRLFLHAQTLSFDDAGGERVTVSAELEPDLQQFLDAL